ncbi:MAG: nucleoside deaminase [Bacteroidia bacterium]|nr:nucleoside deaminase [Bacteroidia bacterium]MCZ2278211.1 nucleoside deaminase [Bacteroidia bacterium]
MRDDLFYIQRCIELGKAALLKGNPPVGAIIVKDDLIISEAEEAGSSKKDITCHAEIEAVRMATRKLNTSDLSDCILYSSHEPCIMCSYAIRYYRIKKVVFQNTVEFLGGVSSSMPLLRSDEVPPHWSSVPEIIQLSLNEN